MHVLNPDCVQALCAGWAGGRVTVLCQGGPESKENPWGSSKWLFLQSLGTAPMPGREEAGRGRPRHRGAEGAGPGGLHRRLSGEEPACQCWRLGFNPWVGTIPGEGRAPHSSIPAWEIPWTEEPGGLQSMGSQIGND